MVRPKKVKRLYGKKKQSRKFGSSNYHSLRLLDLSNPDCPEYDHTMTMSKLTCRELLSQIRPFVTPKFRRAGKENSFSFPILKAKDCDFIVPFRDPPIEFPVLRESEPHIEIWMWKKRGRFLVREDFAQ